MFGNVKKQSTPLTFKDHPEEDSTEVLNATMQRKFQMLIGMLNWLATIEHFDIAYSVTSLARFVTCPRKGHLDRAIRVFGYLQKFPNRRIRIDHKDPIKLGSDET